MNAEQCSLPRETVAFRLAPTVWLITSAAKLTFIVSYATWDRWASVSLYERWTIFCLSHWYTIKICSHLGHFHAHRLFAGVGSGSSRGVFHIPALPLPVVSLILNTAQERCLYIETGSVTCSCSYILGKNTKNAKDNTGYIQF